MKLKELESYLSQCEQFKKPKIQLEQYATSAHVAARMIYAAQEDIQGSIVCDLGSGCGILCIGSVMVGAEYVCGFEVDDDAIELAVQNKEEVLDEDSSTLDFIQTEVKSEHLESGQLCHRFKNFFDVVIMNPPFGTKTVVGADTDFLKYAKHIVRPGGHIFSLHKSSTRPFFERKLGSTLGLKGKVLAEVNYELPKCYKFHKEKSVEIAVDFWKFDVM